MVARNRSSQHVSDPSAETAEDVPVAVSAEAARTIVLNSLNQAARTRKQLADLLRKRSVSDEVADEVLDRFVEVGLVDDREFAENWVRSRHAVRGLSRRVLCQELRQRGISDLNIEAALEQIDDQSEYLAATELAERKLRSLSRYDEAAQRRRLMGMLMRRGYAGSIASAVVADVLGSQAAGYEVST